MLELTSLTRSGCSNCTSSASRYTSAARLGGRRDDDGVRCWRQRSIARGFALCFGAVSALVGAEALAAGEPSPVADYSQVSTEVKDQARQLWDRGVAASEAGDFEVALASFQQAYSLIPHPATLRNLGLMELETGRFVDAARHLAGYLESGLSDSPELVRSIEEKLESAERMVGRVILKIHPKDAVVTVDGERVPMPLRENTWHVSPGSHIVEARLHGLEFVTREVSVPVAESREVAIDFRSPPEKPRMHAARTVQAQPLLPGLDSEREMVWSDAKFWTVIASGSLAAVSLGVGVYGTIRFSTLSNDADALRAEARRTLDGSSPCGPDGTPEARVCTRLGNTIDDRDAAGLVANVGWVGAGVFGATAVAAWLLWPDGPRESARDRALPLAIWGSRGEGGAELRGRF